MYIILIVIVAISLASVIYYNYFAKKDGKPAPKTAESFVVSDDCPSCKQEMYQAQPAAAESDVVVDRLVFANRNSQLRSMGDPIRGDLPIVPNATGWFTPSVSPQVDLQRGAMKILGGASQNSEQMKTLLDLSTSGLLPVSELPFNSTSGTTYAQLGNRNQDLTVTSFP